MRLRFEEVSIKGIRRWIENGCKRQETKVFMQTINPFNKNAAGQMKSREEIMEELLIERKAWLAEERNPVAKEGRKNGKEQ